LKSWLLAIYLKRSYLNGSAILQFIILNAKHQPTAKQSEGRVLQCYNARTDPIFPLQYGFLHGNAKRMLRVVQLALRV
jgi:hypothetical protein